MTNLDKKNELAKLNNRLNDLNNRYDKLIEYNYLKRCTSMITDANGKLIPNPKTDRYLTLLLEIKRQKKAIWIRKRELDTTDNLKNGINALVTLTRNDLFNLTSPTLCQ